MAIVFIGFDDLCGVLLTLETVDDGNDSHAWNHMLFGDVSLHIKISKFRQLNISRFGMQERIAVVFDFDDTLGPDSTTGFLKHAGHDDIDIFWKEVGAMMRDGWDPVPAYLHHMIEASRTGRISTVSKEALVQWGKSLPLFDGVQSLFDHLRAVVK